MTRTFVSGSSTGLGLLAGKRLLGLGHEVIFHARNKQRAAHLEREISGRASIVIGDLGSIRETLIVADLVNALGPIDVAIHNAGVGYGGAVRRTADDLPDTFAVNVLAPYILTAKIAGPTRLIYLSSSMHQVAPDLDDPLWHARLWSGPQAYSESKFYATVLAFAIARRRPECFSNAVDPGWVPTQMGGQGAPNDIDEGVATQIALATGGDGHLAQLTGRYLHHMACRDPAKRTQDSQVQDWLLALCSELTRISL